MTSDHHYAHKSHQISYRIWRRTNAMESKASFCLQNKFVTWHERALDAINGMRAWFIWLRIAERMGQRQLSTVVKNRRNYSFRICAHVGIDICDRRQCQSNNIRVEWQTIRKCILIARLVSA